MTESHEQDAAHGAAGHEAHDVPDDLPDDQGTPTTRGLRTVGQRRRDSEMKLEQHLQEARRLKESGHTEHKPTEDVEDEHPATARDIPGSSGS